MEEKTAKPKFLKMLINLIIVVGLILLALWFYKFQIKEVLKEKPLPTLSEIQKIIFAPEPLLGPKREERAKELDPEIVLKWTNFYRQENNIAALKENSALKKAAEAKLEDMFQKQYFEHVSPDNKNASFWVEQAGYKYIIIGENLALGDYQNEKELTDAWMASSGHRANILNSKYIEIGVAIKLDYFKGSKTFLAVQIFGASASLCKSPDENLKNIIADKKTEYKNLKEVASQIKTLTEKSKKLMKEGNEKIKEGNEADNKEEAEKLWAEGKTLQREAQKIYEEAEKLQEKIKNADELYNEIKILIEKYNEQVKNYNNCLQQYTKE